MSIHLSTGHSLTATPSLAIIYLFVTMLTPPLIAIAGAIAVSLPVLAMEAAQATPPTITLGDTQYTIDFKQGVFAENIAELQAQPWYAVNDFTLAAEATRQTFDCGAGSPFEQPACATSFDAFDQVGSGFGGLSPWFVYDVEAGVAATAVGFSEVTGGGNVLRQVNTSLDGEQAYAIAIAASIPPTEPATKAIPEPMSVAAILVVGTVMVGCCGRPR